LTVIENTVIVTSDMGETMKIICAALLATILSATASHAMTYDFFLTQADEKVWKEWLWTSGEAMSAAQAAYQVAGYPSLYCQPSYLLLAEDQYIEIFASQVRKLNIGAGEFSMGEGQAVLFAGLVETFPCKK
jgi:hypothetical protein